MVFGNLGANRIEQEIEAVVSVETRSETTANLCGCAQFARSSGGHRLGSKGVTRELERVETPSDPTVPAPQIKVHDITLRSGIAMVEVTVTEPDRHSYREVRFYRADPNDGWLRTAPDAGFWGPEQTIETDHFRLLFHRKDAPTVLRAAPKLDAIYEQLRQDVGLPPDERKLTVVVNPVSVYQMPDLYFTGDRLVVHSPYLLQVPVDVSDEAVLIKSIVNPLVSRLLGEAPRLETTSQQWWPILNGLRLWEAYVGSDSQAAWYRDVVTWYYRDARAIRQEGARQTRMTGKFRVASIESGAMRSPIVCRIPCSAMMPTGEGTCYSPRLPRIS